MRHPPDHHGYKDCLPSEALSTQQLRQLQLYAGWIGAGGRTLADIIPSGRTSDPVQQVISSEEIQSLVGCLQQLLSPLESDVLRHYLSGLSYEDISEVIEHDTKTVDNALQRIKRKVNLHLEGRNLFSLI